MAMAITTTRATFITPDDGFDSSRDMVAFYAHDGGATNCGGDGNFYFRVDMQDLKAYAEQGNLDIYVAINLGNPGTGEYNLPDKSIPAHRLNGRSSLPLISRTRERLCLGQEQLDPFDRDRTGPEPVRCHRPRSDYG